MTSASASKAAAPTGTRARGLAGVDGHARRRLRGADGADERRHVLQGADVGLAVDERDEGGVLPHRGGQVGGGDEALGVHGNQIELRALALGRSARGQGRRARRRSRRRGVPGTGSARSSPFTARFRASTAPEVKITPSSSAPTRAATWRRARSRASAGPRPHSCRLDGLPKASPRNGSIASRTRGSTGVATA